VACTISLTGASGLEIHFDITYLQQKANYAITGRSSDPTVEGPVLAIAGIGSDASQAAGEFVVSPESLQILARSAPHRCLDRTLEALLKVEVIEGNTGAASVVASPFW
jgi:hypothetical protein